MCRVVSCVVERGCLLWPVHSLDETLLAFVMIHFVLQGQTYVTPGICWLPTFVFQSPMMKPCEIAQSCLTLCDPMACNLLGSSVHGILQARVLESVVISFSRGSSQPRDWTQVYYIAGRHFTIWAIREVSMMRKTIFFSVLEGLVGHHRCVQLQLLWHYLLGQRLGLLWYWMVCLGMNREPLSLLILHLSTSFYSLLLTMRTIPFLL